MSIWNDICRLFFPRCCLLCGRRLWEGEEHLCFQCLSGLPKTRMHLRSDNEVEKSMWGKVSIERGSAFLHYTKGSEVRRLFYELKYYGNFKLGWFLGRWMAAELTASGFFEGVDCIVPVPLHDKKRKKRGYNQSRMLAEGISEVIHVPVLEGMLSRVQDSETQTHKTNYERWMNVKEAFECTDSKTLEGKHVLLVDDVMTTGATIVACIDALNQIPDLKISVLTLAIAGEA